MPLRRLPPILLVLLWCAAPPARAVEDRGRGPDPAFVARLDALLADPALAGGFQGVLIQSLKDGGLWYERNPDLRCIPASNEKLLTSAAVLNGLGPDWRYVTTLRRGGPIDDDGVLHGDLFLQGSGDPLLAASDLDALVEAAKRAGLRRVAGRVRGDDTRFDAQRYGEGWSWDDMPFYYSAPVSALNLDENLVELRFAPGRRAGDPVRVTVGPVPGYVVVDVRARTTPRGGRSALVTERALGRNVITVSGSLALDAKPDGRGPERVTVEDPARFAAAVLADRLRRGGIAVGGVGTGAAPPGAREVARREGLPLSEVLKRLNKPSDNLAAECLLKTLGAEKGAAGSTRAGRDVAAAWFQTLGMDLDGVAMTDGSGLSRQTLITARNLATLLRAMWSHPLRQVFVDSLPIAGVDGTLRSRMKGTPAEGNCRAKSGYVSGVSSLSGYVTTRDGEPLLFVILMNNHRARNALAMAVQNRIVEMLAGTVRPAP